MSSHLFDRFDGARRGAPGALDAFLRECAEVLEAWCMHWQASMLVRLGLAEDVVQDALFQVWRHFRTCRAVSAFELLAWLHAIGRHAAIDALRANHPERRAAIRIISLDDSAESIAGYVLEANGSSSSASVLAADVLAMLDRTSDATVRELLWRRLVINESWFDIGVALGVSWTAARRRYQRAIQRARAYVMAASANGAPRVAQAVCRRLR